MQVHQVLGLVTARPGITVGKSFAFFSVAHLARVLLNRKSFLTLLEMSRITYDFSGVPCVMDRTCSRTLRQSRPYNHCLLSLHAHKISKRYDNSPYERFTIFFQKPKHKLTNCFYTNKYCTAPLNERLPGKRLASSNLLLIYTTEAKKHVTFT